jgi:integrase/recombinase XerD
MTPLRRRYIEDLRLKNFSPNTIRVYMHAVAAFARFCGRSPEALGEEDVRKYLVHLVSDRRLSRSLYRR